MKAIRILSGLLIPLFFLSFTACHKDKKDLGDQLDDTGDQIEDTIEDTGDEIEDATD